ncbi:MAG: DMT family transporter, partial [Pseudomonadota bacterium]
MPPAAPPAPATFQDNLRGAGFMAVSMAGFAANDALMKVLAVQAGFFEAVLLRGVGATALMALIAWRLGALRRRPARADAPALALRCAAEVCATVCYLTALTRLPLATVSSVAQTMPLMITFAGAVVLGERVGWRRWAAVAAGFIGVLVILRPGAEFQPAVLWALAGVTCFTIRDMATRRLSAQTASPLVTLLTAAAVTLMAGVVLAWRTAAAPEAAQAPWAQVGAPEALGLAAAV